MPVNTKLYKSGEKKVQKARRKNISGRLNRAARDISRAESNELVPGVATELFDRKATQTAKRKHTTILANRRRRH
jgi:hypothetical protein